MVTTTQVTDSLQLNLRQSHSMLAAIFTQLWIVYPCLMIAALVLNRENREALLLILLVAITYYLPVKLITNYLFTTDLYANYYAWYGICIGAEILIIAASLIFISAASILNAVITFLLLSAHLASYFSDSFKNYHILAISLEYLQMLCFIVISAKFIDYAVLKLTPLFVRKNSKCKIQQSGYSF